LLLYSRGFLQGKRGFGIHPFGINNEPKTVSKGIADEIEGIVRIPPRGYGAWLRVVSNAQRGNGGATLVGGPYFAEIDFIISSAVSPSVEL
jgi:hypothetical protein